MALSAPTFGEMLRQLRRRVGLTQGELALIVGFSVAQISRLEKDERLPDLVMLAEKFLPALALADEPRLAQRLIELAATARGERPPTAIIAQREVRTVVREEQIASDHQLALALLPLVGRTQELDLISKRLMAAPGRLLTLIGPPGVGKTQLAITVAAKVQPLFLDGVYVTPLAAVTDPDHVPSAIVSSLGLTDNDRKAPRVKLLEYLRRKSALLVLDNFEQVSAAAPLVAELLGECPELRILATSQEPLRLRTEQRQQVQPLAPAAAVELFLQRTQAINPEFDASGDQAAILTTICLRLDCLPLAIELVAAQLELFAPAQLLTRLQDHQLDLLTDGPRDLPAHQRTLRNAIHRSYALLTAQEQRLFRTLSVFAGGCTVEALVAMLGETASGDTASEATAHALHTLHTLVRKSLVQQLVLTRTASAASAVPASHTQERFDLLTTLGAYALEQLVAMGEAESCRRNHAVYYLAWAQVADQQSRGIGAKDWFDRVATEHDNLRAALTWALQNDGAMALRLVAALNGFWATRGHDYEARRWIEQALAVKTEDTATRAAVLLAAGIFARRQADYGAAQRYMAASLALYQTLTDPVGLAIALREAGWLEYDLHHKTITVEYFHASLDLYRQLDDQAGIANLLVCLVHVLLKQSEPGATVQAYLAESLALFRCLNDSEGIARVLQQQGEWEVSSGNYTAAETHFREVLHHWRQVDSKLNIAWGVALVGEAAALQGNLSTAAACYAEAHQIFTLLGNIGGCANVLYLSGEVARHSGNYTQARQVYQESLALCQTLQNRHVTARCLAGLAGVALALGNASQAATLLGAAQYLFDELPPFLPPAAQTEVAQLIATTRQLLGESVYANAWQAGQSMTTREAVILANR